MKKISITGPESSGKTTLSQQLSSHFKMGMVPEFAREFLPNHTGNINAKTLLEIAKGQISLENAAFGKNEFILCDTDMLVLKIWSEEKLNSISTSLLALYHHHIYDFTFLCAPDTEWVEDPLRENPYDRDRLFEKYKYELDKSKSRYEIIYGKGLSRFNLAKEILENYLFIK